MSAHKRCLTLILLVAMILSACVRATPTPVQPPTGETVIPEPAAAQPTPVPGEPATKKVATFIFTQEFDSLNPYYTNMFFSIITNQIWNCWAWDFDDENEPRPVLVTELPSEDNGGISTDGRVITMGLREDIVWSDGVPITSEDFIFTYEAVINPMNVVASVYPFDMIESIEAPDERTVVITFSEPFAPWLGTMWHGLLPAHVLKPVMEAEGSIDGADWNYNPSVGCGPYVFDTWESGSYTRFVRNDNYWGTRPVIDEIFVRFVPDDASQVAALQAGEADLGVFISPSDIPTLEKAGVKILTAFSGYNEGWYLYLGEERGHPALQDVRVRQAIAMAFDRFALNRDLMLDLTKPALTYWDNTPYADPSIEPWPYDPDRARALLDEAGWIDSNGDGVRDKDGVELVLNYGTTIREIRQDTQALAQQQLAAVGVKLELFSYDSDIFFGGYGENGPFASGELDIAEWSDTSSGFPDPDISYWLCSEIPSDESPSGVNWQFICDPELDDLFKLQMTQVDFEERQQTFWQLSRIMYEKVYWYGLWQDPDNWAIGPDLVNVSISGATPFYNIFEWDIYQ